MTISVQEASWSMRAADMIFVGDVIPERWAQLQKWGVQHMPDGTGLMGDIHTANQYRAICERHTADGDLSWRWIACEEFHEALAETEYASLRAELVQTIAVLFSWVEDLDSRQGALVRNSEPQLELAGVIGDA